MDDQLQQLINLQTEQNLLLRKNLSRIKYSLWSLLLLTTLSAIGLGIGVYTTRPKPTRAIPATAATANVLYSGTVTESPGAPRAYSVTPQMDQFEAFPKPTAYPSINVSELLNEKK